MKILFLTVALSFLTFFSAFSQPAKKIVVMITKAHWCPTCRANEAKITNELLPAYSGSGEVAILFNDITNKRTKARSKTDLEAAGVYTIAQKEQSTGLITIINPANGKILQRLYVSNTVTEMKKVIAQSLAGL